MTDIGQADADNQDRRKKDVKYQQAKTSTETKQAKKETAVIYER